MIFKLYYWFLESGMNAICLLMGVFIQTYTDASVAEIGFLMMLQPFTGLLFKPIICSMADRAQAHKQYLMVALLFTALFYSAFLVLPFLGPQVYKNHARACWYFLLASKLLGDVALGGAKSLGDTLAINYSQRIKNDFSIYRMWGTMAWMTFGFVTGHINEISFLPRFTPGFMILVSSNLINLLIVWLWPDEYFKMVTCKPNKNDQPDMSSSSLRIKLTRSLLPRKIVLSYMKAKLLGAFGCSDKSIIDVEKEIQTSLEHNAGYAIDNLDISEMTEGVTSRPVDRLTQLKVLMVLICKDQRILLYCIFFFMSGLNLSGVGFFIMSLLPICTETKDCDYSVLAGLLQTFMAVGELILFYFLPDIKKVFGRVNLACFVMLVGGVKYLFYGLYFDRFNPNVSLVAELLQGMCFAGTVTMMVELAYQFANEVELIMPELVDRGIMKPEAATGQMKVSLAATMQALVSGFFDFSGIGYLIFGIILEETDYSTLWCWLGCFSLAGFLVILAISVCDNIFGFSMGIGSIMKKSCDIEASASGRLSIK